MKNKFKFKITEHLIKNFTAGKKYVCTYDEFRETFDKILNDKKEWVDLNYKVAISGSLCTTRCKFIKDFYGSVKGDIDHIVISYDKKTFLYCGKIYNTKEHLKIL